MIKGWKKLTKKQRKHLCENGCNNTVIFAEVRKEQNKLKEIDAQHGRTPNICFECDQIARVLGVD